MAKGKSRYFPGSVMNMWRISAFSPPASPGMRDPAVVPHPAGETQTAGVREGVPAPSAPAELTAKLLGNSRHSQGRRHRPSLHPGGEAPG